LSFLKGHWPKASSLSFSLAKFLLMGLAAAALQERTTYESTESVATLVAKTDWSCLLRTWRLKGVLACPSPTGGVRTCLWVENAYPCGVLEVVRQAGKSHVAEASVAVAGLQTLQASGATSSHTTDGGKGTGLQFTEARVYTMVVPLPVDLLDLPIARPQGPLFSVNYVSETDGFGWRSGLSDILADPVAAITRASLPSCASVPDPARCAGTWGPYWPRIGFASVSSEVMAGCLLGLRAGRVASAPMARVVVSTYPFEPRTGHYLQPVRPTWKPCLPIGFPQARAIEANSGSKEGAYLYIHFGLFEECRGCLPIRLVGPRSPTGG